MNLDFENNLWKGKQKYIFGLDEVGRGPLAGPVVVCAVFMHANLKLPKEILLMVNDSKKLSHQKRAIIVNKIKNIKGIDFAIAKSSEKEIDKINILNATLKAFKKAVLTLEKQIQHKPDLVVIDGNKIIRDLINYKQQAIIKGDAKIFSVALASIIAKEYRDKLMKNYSKKYSKYEFDINKGYGTKKHIKVIQRFGACDIHRKTFLNNIL